MATQCSNGDFEKNVGLLKVAHKRQSDLQRQFYIARVWYTIFVVLWIISVACVTYGVYKYRKSLE